MTAHPASRSTGAARADVPRHAAVPQAAARPRSPTRSCGEPRPGDRDDPRQARPGRRRACRLGGAAAGRRRDQGRRPARPAGAARPARRRNVTAAGGIVHWARDAAEANAIVAGIARGAGATEVVKVKSMATQEIELNEALARDGHRRLGDRPRRADRPARARPAVATSWSRRSTATATEIRDIFVDEMGRGRPPGAGRPDRRPGASWPRRPACTCARSSCAPGSRSPAPTSRSPRPARSSSLESEGNGRMCLTLPEVLITVHGHREARPDLGGPRGLPAAAAALVDRRADEPVHLDVDRRHARRRAAGVPPDPARQRPHRHARPTRSAGRRCAASAARPA